MFKPDLRYYSFLIHFNPFLQTHEWSKIETTVQQYFLDFINSNDYGDDVMSMTFNFYIENEIDINRQNDNIQIGTHFGLPPNAKLTMHFEYTGFINATDDYKIKMTLNGILFLLNHLLLNYKIKQGTPLEKIICDYKNKLVEEKLYNENIVKNYIKINNPFRFNFMKHHFMGLKENEILFDINDIEKHLNNNLYKHNFGKSVSAIFFSYDIFDFERDKKYMDAEKKYQYGKNKDLSIMEQYNSNLFKYDSNYMDNTERGQIEYLHKGMLEAISRIETMKRKPKDFNIKEFYRIIDVLMNEYENKK